MTMQSQEYQISAAFDCCQFISDYNRSNVEHQGILSTAAFPGELYLLSVQIFMRILLS